jgi:hypothetical protein
VLASERFTVLFKVAGVEKGRNARRKLFLILVRRSIIMVIVKDGVGMALLSRAHTSLFSLQCAVIAYFFTEIDRMPFFSLYHTFAFSLHR